MRQSSTKPNGLGATRMNVKCARTAWCTNPRKQHTHKRGSLHSRSAFSGSRNARHLRTSITGTQLEMVPTNGSKWFAAQWLENSASLEVPVAVEKCFGLWSDRELIPSWMPWIHSVKVLEDQPALSRWTLKTYQFGRDWEFSWVARNLAPIPLQKIHWISEDDSVQGSLGTGVPLSNRGQVRFYRRSPKACGVSLSVSYEVPDILAPFLGALTPLVENILLQDLKLFSNFAQKKRVVDPEKT